MDLSKRGPLTAVEKTLISQTLQIFTLDGLGAGLSDKSGRMMFHGGTSISTTHGSPRWSEDLDFVVSPGMAGDLSRLRPEIEKIAARRIEEITPGARFKLVDKGDAKGKVRVDDPGTVMRWVGRWEHPMRVGVVKIKNEFYIAEPGIVREYQTRDATPQAIGISCYNNIPCATLETIWSDKIMAMSARPVMKWRDVFDVGYIMDKLPEVADDTLFERMGVAARSYRSSTERLLENLDRQELVDLADHYDAFEADMRKWLPSFDFEEHFRDGRLKAYHGSCVMQVERAKEILALRLKGPGSDMSCGF
ncbi:nucleotidyl transferase AbiEii/AbiGii toxin family protein [Pseudosulfitobacter pseudonitzschiae]|uniref:nucleotidyl transferase AbiEii/AbiGii toxin family protein n=1 Tax=Pseudosulfitobacter pseudonitzschiae TaxID=1402135 RepID=UPI003B78C5D1